MAVDLWQIRRRKKMTIEELARQAGIPPRIIKEYELGERPIASQDLEKLAGALMVEPWEIKELSDPPPRGPSRHTNAPRYGSQPGPARYGDSAGSRYGMDMGNSSYRQDSGSSRYRGSSYDNNYQPRRTTLPPDRGGSYDRRRRESGPRPPKKPRSGPRRQPVAAARPSQIEHLKNLIIRLEMTGDDLLRLAGKPLSMLNRKEAARLLTQCQNMLAEQKPPRPKGKRQRPYLPESVDEHELVYLTEVQLSKRDMRLTLFNGDVMEGKLLGFSPYALTITNGQGQETTIQKLAIAYYQVQGTEPEAEDDGEEAES